MYFILCQFLIMMFCENDKSITYDSVVTCRNLRCYKQFRNLQIQ